MITKISKLNYNFFAVAYYHQEKMNKGKCRIIDSHLLYSTKPKQIGRIMRFFSQFGQTKQPVFHVSLSFPKKDLDELTDEKLQSISRDYLNGMGYAGQPYIIYRHYDTEYPYLHILSMRVDIKTQKKIANSFEQYHSQSLTRELEQKYGLVVVEQQAKNLQQIEMDVKAAMSYEPLDYEELNTILNITGSIYRIKRIKNGIIFFRFAEKEHGNSPFWKGSRFKKMGYDKKGLETIFYEHTRKWLTKVLEF